MRIERVRVANFRSLRDVEVDLDGLTILIGANSSGKTSVLEALRMLGDEHSGISKADFFPGATTIEIEAAIDPEGDGDIPPEYVIGGRVTVQKTAELGDGDGVTELLRVKKMCIADLVGIRDMRTAKERQAGMRALLPKHPGLRHTGAWPGNLNSYEHDHLDDPAHKDKYAPHFVDLRQSDLGSGRLLDVMYVPAARNIEADAEDGRGSLLDELIEVAIRRSGAHEARLQEIADEANRKARRAMRGVNRDGRALAGRMRRHALPYAENIEFRLEFHATAIQNSRPRATLTLVEDGLPIPMGKAGSGAQRVYLMSLLETIYHMGGAGDGDGDGKGARASDGGNARAMLIDEPELYQHPQRQRRILRALGRLADDLGMQVVCSTHSPYLVWLEEIGRVRRLQKVGKETAVCRTTVGRLADSVNHSRTRSRQVDAVRMAALLDLVSSRWITEGLFARMVVLVEGPGDRSMLLATARAMGISLDEAEISIVPCEGKHNLPHVLQVFRHLGVPAYLVWDVDRATSKRDKLLNLGLQGLSDPKAPAGNEPTGSRFALRYSRLAKNLSSAMIKAVGGQGGLLEEKMEHYGMDAGDDAEKKKAMHNQRIMYEMLVEIKGSKRRFGRLPTVKIIKQIVRMRRGVPGWRKPARRRRC